MANNVVTNEVTDELTNIGETEVIVKKHPIRDFFTNHPAITTIGVGILAALGGYTVGNLMADDYEDYDLDADFEALDTPETATE